MKPIYSVAGEDILNKQQWKYRISDGYTGTILAFFLFSQYNVFIEFWVIVQIISFNELYKKIAQIIDSSEIENKNKQGTQISFIRRLATVAAFALVLFIGSNGIVYAATGSRLPKTVKVYFDGSSYEVNLEEKTGEDDKSRRSLYRKS